MTACLRFVNVFVCLQKKDGFLTTSNGLTDRKVDRFDKNIKKRGLVPEMTTKKKDTYPVGPIVLGFFIFVVIGSCYPYTCSDLTWCEPCSDGTAGETVQGISSYKTSS
nr:stress-associated endoplasmic reticulum protein 2-like [Tanacetum cinerariifolium]